MTEAQTARLDRTFATVKRRAEITAQIHRKLDAVVAAKALAAANPRATAASRTNATARWKAAVSTARATVKTHAQAIAAVEKTHPGLRLQMLAEVNAR